MILGLKLRKVGNAPCAVLPVKRTRAEVKQQLKVGQEVIRRYRSTLGEVAK